MKRIFLLILTLSAALFLGCDESNPIGSEKSPFEGTWGVLFAIQGRGSIEIAIDKNGTFSEEIQMTFSGSTITVTLSGTVNNAGTANAIMVHNGAQIGTITGTLSNESGHGSYEMTQPEQEYGAWVATKRISSVNPYNGGWIITIGSDALPVQIDNWGNCAVSMGNSSAPTYVMVSVSESGIVYGGFYIQGTQNGLISGTFSLTSESGSGTYQITQPPENGTWTAQKVGVNPFTGIWEINCTGDFTMLFDLTVDTYGFFSDTVSMIWQGVNIELEFTGTVSQAGSVDGIINYTTLQVGSLTGTLSGTTGSGTFELTQPQQANGTWTGVKQFEN